MHGHTHTSHRDKVTVLSQGRREFDAGDKLSCTFLSRAWLSYAKDYLALLLSLVLGSAAKIES